MIGNSIGAFAIGAALQTDLTSQVTVVTSGYLGFVSTFPPARAITTLLDFTVITNDDNIIQTNVTDEINMLPFDLSGASVTVNIYAPGTETNPIIMVEDIDIVLGTGQFQWPLTHAQVEGLASGHYPWIALVDLPGGTQHTVSCGDINQTTGTIYFVNRP
jgi:hypothetical protein